MSYHKDLDTQIVKGIDFTTGYPKSEHGHLLDPICHKDGCPVENWDKNGIELYNLTNPYGFLEYVVGGADDFHCFDFKVVNAGPKGEFIILDSTINSETGSFIQGCEYLVLPVNSHRQKQDAVQKAVGMVWEALQWCFDNDLKHDKAGWNQAPMYFAADVAKELFPYKFEKVRSNTRNFSKTISKIINEILNQKED